MNYKQVFLINLGFKLLEYRGKSEGNTIFYGFFLDPVTTCPIFFNLEIKKRDLVKVQTLLTRRRPHIKIYMRDEDIVYA